jgi:hypothetical protein
MSLKEKARLNRIRALIFLRALPEKQVPRN